MNIDLQQHAPIVVEWRDAYHDFDFVSGDPYRDYIVKTNGFYVGHDKTWLHLVMEILPDGDGYRGLSHIPLVLLQTINGERV